MQAVKILPKGQITLPREVRKELDLKEGDTLIIEKKDNGVFIKKGKTIFDYVGFLPKLDMTIEEMREKALEAVVNERG